VRIFRSVRSGCAWLTETERSTGWHDLGPWNVSTMKRMLVHVLALACFGVASADGYPIVSRVELLNQSAMAQDGYLRTQGATVTGVQVGATGVEYTAQFSGFRTWVFQNFETAQNWSNAEMLTCVMTNFESRPVRIGFMAQTRQDLTDYTNSYATDIDLPANTTRRVILRFQDPAGNPWGTREMPKAFDEEVIIRRVGSTFDNAHVWHWRFSSQETLPTSVKVSDFSLVTTTSDIRGISDEFFQYSFRDWPGKIQSVGDLFAARDQEALDLAANPGPGGLDGTTSLPNQGASSRWRIATINGKKYFVHPSGKPFWSLSIQAAHDWMTTWVDNRRELFQYLPSESGTFSDLYVNQTRIRSGMEGTVRAFLPVRYNLRLKYGENYLNPWLNVMRQRLRSWGMNTVGAFSHSFLYDNAMPYTIGLDTTAYPTRLDTPVVGWLRLPDPYASDFQTWMTNRFRTDLGVHATRSNLIGVMVDNEMSWGNTYDGTNTARYSVAVGTLNAPSTQPAKVALINFLKSRYQTISRLNSAWGTRYSSWGAMQSNRSFSLGSNMRTALTSDFRTFTQRFASTYFTKVRNALNGAGFTGLYLGCRFSTNNTPEVVTSAAASVDVLTFNWYGANAQTPWSYWSSLGKPVMISEWSVPINSRGSLGFNLLTPNSKRQEMTAFLTSAIRNPNIVGLQWFETYDQPVTGRGVDGENRGFGALEITDTPNPDVIATMRQIGNQLYSLRR